MIFLKAKDLKNRVFFNKNEVTKKIKKFLFIHLLNNNIYSQKQKSDFLYFFLKKEQNHKSKIRLRCIITNRSRGNFRPFNVSRLVLREMIHLGIVPGYTKAVW
jgi:small subunit ribosomal protein S14